MTRGDDWIIIALNGRTRDAEDVTDVFAGPRGMLLLEAFSHWHDNHMWLFSRANVVQINRDRGELHVWVGDEVTAFLLMDPITPMARADEAFAARMRAKREGGAIG